MDEGILMRKIVRRRAAILIWSLHNGLSRRIGFSRNAATSEQLIIDMIRYLCTAYGNAKWEKGERWLKDEC